MKKDNVKNLAQLGTQSSFRYENPGEDILEIFHNQFPARNYITEFIFNEFTSLCPKTKHPDFATITIQYIPNKYCIETKSLKLYFLAFRNQGAFMETITNQILEDCAKVCKPRWMKVHTESNARGGTLINVMTEYGKK